MSEEYQPTKNQIENALVFAELDVRNGELNAGTFLAVEVRRLRQELAAMDKKYTDTLLICREETLRANKAERELAKAKKWNETQKQKQACLRVGRKTLERFERERNDARTARDSALASLAKAKEEVEQLRTVLGDQHYYETDCSGCADNMKYANEVLK